MGMTNQRQTVGAKNATHSRRLTGEAIMRIHCQRSGRVVGYLYQWNNGDLQPAWLNGALTDVRYEPVVEAAWYGFPSVRGNGAV